MYIYIFKRMFAVHDYCILMKSAYIYVYMYVYIYKIYIIYIYLNERLQSMTTAY